jgi:hypothetical protein
MASDVVPMTIKRLNRFEPMTFPREMALPPPMLSEMLIAASGALVPKETTVSPMISEGTRSLAAIDEAPSTKKSAPFISRKSPAASKMYFIPHLHYYYHPNMAI